MQEPGIQEAIDAGPRERFLVEDRARRRVDAHDECTFDGAVEISEPSDCEQFCAFVDGFDVTEAGHQPAIVPLGPNQAAIRRNPIELHLAADGRGGPAVGERVDRFAEQMISVPSRVLRDLEMFGRLGFVIAEGLGRLSETSGCRHKGQHPEHCRVQLHHEDLVYNSLDCFMTSLQRRLQLS